MMNNIKRYAPIILIVVIALLLAVGYFFVWPEYGKYAEKRIEFNNKDKEIKAKEEYLPRLQVESDKLAQYVEQIEVMKTALPFEPSIAALFSYFQKLTAENGLILKEIDVAQLFLEIPEVASAEGIEGIESISSKTKIKEMPFSITVTGSYTSLKNLLKEIYLSSRIIEVTSIEFSAVENENGSISTLFDFKLGLKTQSYK